MEVEFTARSREDLLHWKNSGNKVIQKKITALLEQISSTPFEGIGKPEALKHDLSGLWSRRIDKEHRLVYKIENNKIVVISLRYHYDQ